MQSRQARKTSTHALPGTMLELFRPRKRKFPAPCAKPVQDNISLWKFPEKLLPWAEAAQTPAPPTPGFTAAL